MNQSAHWLLRAYAQTLALYPRRFRVDFGDEMRADLHRQKLGGRRAKSLVKIVPDRLLLQIRIHAGKG